MVLMSMSVELKSTSAGQFGSAERGHIKTERERKRDKRPSLDCCCFSVCVRDFVAVQGRSHGRISVLWFSQCSQVHKAYCRH